MPISHAVRSRSRGATIVLLGTLATTIFAASLRAEPAGTGDPAIRQIVSKHLTLLTDLPASEDVDSLPAIFDQAFPQWCAYFEIDPAAHSDWHMRGHLMQSRQRFEAAGLLPAGLTNFTSGYARGGQLWLYDQSSPYYRRHLLLHEGTHAFMYTFAGGVGPSWYAEGTAELLGTHSLVDGRLTLGYFPKDRDEVSKWGRIEIVETDYADHRAMSLAKIVAFRPGALVENTWYGWSWAAAAFLDGHPRYQAHFRALRGLIGQPDFSEQLPRVFGDDWRRAQEDWQLFVANLDYGYDFSRMEVEHVAGKPLGIDGATAQVASDRGWQASGVRLEAGQKYHLRASGRYQLATEPRVWWCEPGGVTIRYYRGLPLGILLAAVRSDDPDAKTVNGLLKPQVVGRETTLTALIDGTLYLRINDAPGSLGDNRGTASVRITRE